MSVRNCEDDSRILHDVHRNTGKGQYEAYLYAEWSTGKRLSSEVSGEQVSRVEADKLDCVQATGLQVIYDEYPRVKQIEGVTLSYLSVCKMEYGKASKHCGVRHPMKLVPFATRVCMDVKAFPRRPNVPLLITNGIVHHRLRRDSRVALVPV
ncbi:hypothetical protein T02_3892 [Trichinella nativa]|uniref:Uncharacterized protein n=1 Tax=Trichinella nativa TaxID=6335 RepID=A0A0V1KMV5_9BILA|nr:hypothetical protein T02_3892 [Trichinella nativa]